VKILFTISSTVMGGAEKQLLYLITEAKKSHQCSLAVLAPKGGMTSQYLRLGVETFECTRENTIGIIRQIKNLRRIIKEQEVDVIQSFLYESDILICLASIGLNRKIFWTAGNVKIPNLSFHKRAILSVFSKIFPEKIFPNSEQAYDFHASIGYPRSKMEIVDNFLPTVPVKKELLNSKTGEREKFKIGMAARPVMGKGHLTLIRAVEYLESLDFPFSLEFIGDGIEEWDFLVHEIEKSTARDQIRLLPSRDHLEDWYESLDCYVLASEEWESFPNTLTEAIMLECPVISSDVANIARAKFGIRQIFPIGDSAALGKLLRAKAEESQKETRTECMRLKELLLVSYSNSKSFLQWEKFWTQID
jgi:glycosyltransferase involved in cell wall biosynthesis